MFAAIDGASGDFSFPAAGFVIEKSRPTHPVLGISIAGNLFELLRAVDKVGSDLTWFNNVGCPTPLLEVASPRSVSMRTVCAIVIACTVLSLSAGLSGQAPAKKKVLCIGQVKGFQHDSVTYGLASIWKWGQETGLYDTYIRTDCELVTKKKLPNNAKNLDWFDAVVFYTTGELDLDDSQKADLLSFVRDDGKGFVGVHSAPDTFYKWPEYGEMIGGYFDGHPWNTFKAPILIEDPNSPMTRHFAAGEIVVNDEIYQVKDWSRDKVRVLMRLNEDKLDLTSAAIKPRIKRTDKDWAVTWIKSYGKGRVFYSTLGHTYESWDSKDVAKMFLEGVKWAVGLTEASTNSHPKPVK